MARVQLIHVQTEATQLTLLISRKRWRISWIKIKVNLR